MEKLCCTNIFLSRKNSCWFFFFIMISEKKEQAKQETFYSRKCQIRACLIECFIGRCGPLFFAENRKCFYGQYKFHANIQFMLWSLSSFSTFQAPALYVTHKLIDFMEFFFRLEWFLMHFLILYHASNHDEIQ